jgi:fatty-acyl-CoA synthase
LHDPPTYRDLLLGALRRHPDRIAFAEDGGGLTYRELAALALRWAGIWQEGGVRPGDGIALLSGNRPELFAAQAAAILLGCRYTPLHRLGSEDDHAFILEDGEISILVFDPLDFEQRATRLRERVAGLRSAFSFEESAVAQRLPGTGEPGGSAPTLPPLAIDDLACLSYTGGTTGKPKGVVRPHRAMVANACFTLTAWQWPATPRFLIVNPMSHATGLMILPILMRGGTVHLEDHFDAELFPEIVQRHQINSTFLVPTMLYRIIDQLEGRGTELATLETVIYGGGPTAPSRLAEAQESLGQVFMQLYGQAEAPNTVAVLLKEEHDPAHPTRLASCGKPVIGVEVQIQDEDGKELPDGEVGEICVRGPHVMEGYWKAPDLTAEALRDGWLRTGDLAHRDGDGYLAIVDRRKDMIISGGFNVYPREIEEALLTHADVSSVAVIGVPDDNWGEAVKAIVVPRPGTTLEPASVIEFVRERKGPMYAPKSVDIVEEIPMTSVGKPDKNRLREAFWSDQPRGVH